MFANEELIFLETADKVESMLTELFTKSKKRWTQNARE